MILCNVYCYAHLCHQVSGLDPPKPVSSFGHFGFDEKLLGAVRKSEYTQPTPIQAQVMTVSRVSLSMSYSFFLAFVCVCVCVCVCFLSSCFTASHSQLLLFHLLHLCWVFFFLLFICLFIFSAFQFVGQFYFAVDVGQEKICLIISMLSWVGLFILHPGFRMHISFRKQ